MSGAEANAFLKVENLSKWYSVRRGARAPFKKAKEESLVKAVDGVSFFVEKGEVLGIIGESGCGKSTLSRLLVQIEPQTGGYIRYEDVEASEIVRKNARAFHAMAQIIFQNPFDTFPGWRRIQDILMRTLSIHKIGAGDRKKYEICRSALEGAGLAPAEDYLKRYPHELSGGQLQRVSIVRSMLLRPKFIVADEPVSMLDVSIRIDIINMLKRLSRTENTALIFISHDIATTRYISDRVAVMYLGRIVETGKTDDVLQNPLHPYTRLLISSCTSVEPDEQEKRVCITGPLLHGMERTVGCAFAPRCPCADGRCFREKPPTADAGNGHCAECFFCRVANDVKTPQE